MSAAEKFERLVALMARLRAPGGCPWDREQTFDSIKPHTLEETYEVLDAIDRHDWPDLAEELGDYILQAVFYAQMAAEQDLFTIEDALEAINRKLLRRHPHIFGDESASTAGDVKRIWSEVKAAEKAAQGRDREGLLTGVPRTLPALVEAQQITSRAAQVGFDWENPEQVLDKLEEELREFAEARRGGSPAELENELGLPSTQPISRRYQYGFPLITFLYRLAINLGHRSDQTRSQAPQARVTRENRPPGSQPGPHPRVRRP